jgi:hypothetical protein
VEAAVLFSTGDDDYSRFVEGNTAGNATAFTAVTPVGRGAVFSLESGNTTVSEVSYGIRPLSGTDGLFESFSTRATFFSFFRTAGTGPVSASVVDAASDTGYLGSEVDLQFRWRPFSDLGVGVTTGFLFANGDALVDGAETFDYVLGLNASLSF